MNELEEISPYTQTRVQSSKLILFPIGRLYQGDKMNQEETYFSMIICLPEKYKVYCIEFVKRKSIDHALYEESTIQEFLQLGVFKFRKEFQEANLQNWERITLSNQSGSTNDQNSHCQGVLSMLWMGHQLTQMDFKILLETFSVKESGEVFIKEMFDFIDTFNKDAANSLILRLMLNQNNINN
jgi:hypothetical protein